MRIIPASSLWFNILGCITETHQRIARACKRAGVDAIYCELNSTYGHDAFLVEVDEQTHLVTHFLQRVSG